MVSVREHSNMSDVATLPITVIIADDDFQARESGLSESHVALLAESNPCELPPILVAPLGDGTYGVLDGFHRLAAAELLGVETIRCIVAEGAGYPEAVAANIHHGLPLSKADRKAAARWWADREPTLSHAEIGRRVGLSDKTVTAAIREQEQPSKSKAIATPTSRLVSQVLRIHDVERIGPEDLSAEIDAYAEEWREEVATAMHTVGQSLIAAAAPYVKGAYSPIQ